MGILLFIIYLAFISLGLPDSLLGAGWPVMYKEMSVPLSYAGIISITIAAGTIVSSLLSDRMTKKFGPGNVTVFSVFLTAVALLLFSLTKSFPMLIVCAIPYGLGAGGVDAALNNYVALHYKSQHMSWLHCMWGVGVTISPFVMRYAISELNDWHMGYRIIFFIQVAITVALFFTLPLWKKANENASCDSAEETESGAEEDNAKAAPMPLREVFRLPGAKSICFTFFCYCALEQTTMLWVSTYLVEKWALSDADAAGLASLFFIGITVGRGVNGFFSMRFSDTTMIRVGSAVILLGIILLILPINVLLAEAGFILIGLGCAPIYPSIIHSTPAHFGKDKSQAIIGVEMASAYVGTLAMPPVFGLIGNHISISLLPYYLIIFLIIMTISYQHVVGLFEKGK